MRYPAPAAVLLTLLTGAVPMAQQAQPPAQPAAAGQQQPAQPPPERTQQPTIRSGINFVRVDVIVTDKQGNPVLDMKPEDFSLTEDGKPQKVESFSVVKIDPVAQQFDAPPLPPIRSQNDEEDQAARPDVRLFVLLLDDYHVRRGNDMVVRKPLIDFIQNQLAPADMVAIMYPLTSVNELHFQRDRDALTRAIERFEGRKFDYVPRNQFEEQYAYYPAATVEKVRNDVTMGALKGAAIRMGGLREGRKSIIFVSEGFTSTLPPQLNDPIAAMKGLGNTARGNANAQGLSDSQEFFRETDLMSDLQQVFDTANRQNTSIYAVDPRGLAAFEYDVNEGVGLQTDSKRLNSTMDTLRVLADNTDGRAIVNRNDIGTGMKQIIRDASGYYLIGYNSTQAPTDGRFHEIKVKVTRKNVDVRARKGYWAYTAEDAARATAPPKPEAPAAVTAALNSIAEPARGRPARFWIGTAQGPGASPRVTFAWEPIAGEANADVPARVQLTATAPDGRPIFRGRIPEEGASAAAAPSSTATTGTATAVAAGASSGFEAPPGQLQLRMVVENARGQVMDSVTQELTVPDYSHVQVAMSTPRVYRARTARDVQVLKGNPLATPTAERAFSRAERILVRVDAYAAGGATPTVTARLLNRTGAQMAELPAGQGTPGAAEFELGLSALAAGDYLIELNAKAPSGTAQDLVAFKIVR